MWQPPTCSRSGRPTWQRIKNSAQNTIYTGLADDFFAVAGDQRVPHRCVYRTPKWLHRAVAEWKMGLARMERARVALPQNWVVIDEDRRWVHVEFTAGVAAHVPSLAVALLPLQNGVGHPVANVLRTDATGRPLGVHDPDRHHHTAVRAVGIREVLALIRVAASPVRRVMVASFSVRPFHPESGK
jgi:hypothetical protein